VKKLMYAQLLILAICWCGDSYAQKDQPSQSKSSESYKKYRNKIDVSASRLLLDAEQLKAKDPVSAMDKLEEALAVSVAQQDVFNEGWAYLLLGEINENAGEWAHSLDYFTRARDKLAVAFKEKPQYANAIRGRINANTKLGNLDAALEDCTEALGLSLTSEERRERELDLGEVYYQQGAYDEALRVVDAIVAVKSPNNSLTSRLENLKAKIFARQNDPLQTRGAFDNSLNSLSQANTLSEADVQSATEAKEEIANTFRKQQNYDDEIELRTQSIEFNLKNNNLNEVTKDKVELGATLAAKGDNFAALKELEEAVAIADTLDDPADKANAYLSLANMYERNGRPAQALESFKKYSHAVAEEKRASEITGAERAEFRARQEKIDLLTRDVYVGQSEETVREGTLFRQQLIIAGLVVLVMVTAVTSFFIYRNAQASKLANRLLALKSLRGQMNPHFIFNALNSVNQFISNQDERTANRFLSEFSQLMRLVLENSQEDFISLRQEQEILALYLKLEHYRFRDKFDFRISSTDDIDPELIEIPPMLIQPYIENAVWHGLRYKESKGLLQLKYEKHEDHMVITVEDDGIGRQRSAELKTVNQRKHQSTGLKNIDERMQIINRVYHTDYRVVIDDLSGGTGTRARIFIPLNSRKKQV
jgi:tetratricopeptide (TPR) repeat protein